MAATVTQPLTFSRSPSKPSGHSPLRRGFKCTIEVPQPVPWVPRSAATRVDVTVSTAVPDKTDGPGVAASASAAQSIVNGGVGACEGTGASMFPMAMSLDSAAMRILAPQHQILSYFSPEPRRQIEYIETISKGSEPRLLALVRRAREGMRSGIAPALCPQGVGGTYFLKDAINRPCAVFKPMDEEAWCDNNPKGYSPLASPVMSAGLVGPFSPVSPSPLTPYMSMRNGIQPCCAAVREVAAYVLDHGHFAGVPATTLVEVHHHAFYCSREAADRAASASGMRLPASSMRDGAGGDKGGGAGGGADTLSLMAGPPPGRPSSDARMPGCAGPLANRRTSIDRAPSLKRKSQTWAPEDFAVLHRQKKKIGSFQEYRDHDRDAEDLGSGVIRTFPVHEVHKIAVLDIRLVNTDRHAGNILIRDPSTSRRQAMADGTRSLSQSDDYHRQFAEEDDDDDDDDDEEYMPPRTAAVQIRSESRVGAFVLQPRCLFGDPERGGATDDDEFSQTDSGASSSASSLAVTPRGDGIELIPIDHGYTLPSTLDQAWFSWMEWPQAKEKFDDETQAYIRNLDADEDCRLLTNLFPKVGLPHESLMILRVSTTLLKLGAEAGLTPFDIASMMCRPTETEQSVLERLLDAAIVNCRLEGDYTEDKTLAQLTLLLKKRISHIIKTKDQQMPPEREPLVAATPTRRLTPAGHMACGSDRRGSDCFDTLAKDCARLGITA